MGLNLLKFRGNYLGGSRSNDDAAVVDEDGGISVVLEVDRPPPDFPSSFILSTYSENMSRNRDLISYNIKYQVLEVYIK